MKNFILIISCLVVATFIYSCDSGGNGEAQPMANVVPQPYPAAAQYEPMPESFANALPNFAATSQMKAKSIQIAWGANSNPEAQKLVAQIVMNQGMSQFLCSATPVAGDGNGGTWLVGAAHCFVARKTNMLKLQQNDLLLESWVQVYKGLLGESEIASSATIYLLENYCYNGVFVGVGNCPNLTIDQTDPGGMGNDIALIHIAHKFNEAELYPRINNGSEYPREYTMAKVLSLGYGQNNQLVALGTLFYVINYYYAQQNAPGFHFLAHSYFNSDPKNPGYSALICGGDSGGGDLFWSKTGWILLSEHTYGPANGCGTFFPFLPNGATNVAYYADWLETIINHANPVKACLNKEIVNCVTNAKH